MHFGKNAGRRKTFADIWFFIVAFVPADEILSAKNYYWYFNNQLRYAGRDGSLLSALRQPVPLVAI